MEAEKGKTRTFCRLCQGRCGLLVTVSDGLVVKVEGDPESPPSQRNICPKGMALPEILNHPDRLRYPQKRRGGRGSGEWARISWDEALSTIADRMGDLKAEFGPECLVLWLGSPKGLELAFANRFASAFGTPNVTNPGNICHLPREVASFLTFGSACHPDSECVPQCIVMWGSNMVQTHDANITREQLRSALSKGAKLIVIDPRKTELASRSHLWIRPRPSSDGALALAMIKVIIEEGLYDEAFTSQWTVGFDQLREHVDSYSLDRAEETTWVPKEQIAAAARLYAQTKPAIIQWGNAVDQGINSFQTCRAICTLKAISGNLDIPGGEILPVPLPLVRPGQFMLLRELPRNPAEMIGGECKLATRWSVVPRELTVKAILQGKPYPVKASLLFATNPIITCANSQETYDALTKLELLVVSELFMTPTAALADIVLPAATCCEFNEVSPYPGSFLLAYPKVVEPPGECWSDIKIMNELAKKTGLERYFWADVDEALDIILEPSGMTFREVAERGILQTERLYGKYEEAGFRTASGKVELYSRQLEELGYNPLPTYNEPSETPYSDPEVAREYPLILTNAKAPFYCHSEHRNISSLRRIEPAPKVWLNPETAAGLGLKKGDLVHIETRRGRIRQWLDFDEELDPRVVVAAYGWWLPEKGASEVYGWNEANINMLTDNAPPYDPQLGSVSLRGILCRITKA